MPGGPLNLISTNLPRPWSPRESFPSGKIPMVEPGIQPGTSWLVVRDSNNMYSTKNLFYFIYLYSNQSKKGGKPTGYRTSLNDLNIHTKQLHRTITMNTLLQIYIKKEYKTLNA